MKKNTAITFVCLQLLLVLSTTKLIREANADNAAVMWGIKYNMTEHEINASRYTCEYLYDLFDDTGVYGYHPNYYGNATQRDAIYGNVSYCDNASNFDFATVFYKGHALYYNESGTHPHLHYYLYDNDGGSGGNKTIDYKIHDELVHVLHNFTFIWACGVGNEIGGINGSDSWGMAACWLNTTSLNEDGYANPDNNDLCFIGFRNYSLPFVQETDYGDNNYGSFCRTFYEYALNSSAAYTIKDSLEKASLDTIGKHYNETWLYEGYYWGNASITNETLYFRSDTENVNGLDTEKLRTSRSGTSGYRTKTRTDPEETIQRVHWGMRVYRRYYNGTAETYDDEEITNGYVSLFTRNSGGQGMQSSTWNCPETNMERNDTILVKLYTAVDFSVKGQNPTSWLLFDTWQTGFLNATNLEPETWNISLYTYLAKSPDPLTWTTRVYFDTSTYNSTIANFNYDIGVYWFSKMEVYGDGNLELPD